MTSDSKAPVTDEQRAREWLKRWGVGGLNRISGSQAALAALLARRALEEAKWWQERINSKRRGKWLYGFKEVERQRIAELGQAAASKAAGGDQ